MLKKIITVLFLFAITGANAQTAYVAAPSGLKFRKTASANGEVIKTLPYGTKLNNVKDVKPKTKHKTKEAEGFYLKGFWQKVIEGKDSGYVFSAFLIPVEPLGKKELETYYSDATRQDCKPLDVYFLESRFKAFGNAYDVVKYPGEDTLYYYSPISKNSPYCKKGFKQKFANGNISIEYFSAVGFNGEGGVAMDVTLKGYTFNQVYAIALSLTKTMNDDVKVAYKNGTVNIGPTKEGSGCYSSIKKGKGNIIVWNFSCK